MGLLDVDVLREKLGGLLGEMPISQLLQGKAKVSPAGLLGALRSMPVFDSKNASQSAYEAALNMGPMGIGKIVYHGSPHKFDKFDASKIGTGEGAQAYGHGVYLADAEDVAKGYAKKLSASQDQAALYKADIPDEWIPKMLDWDKPISQQPDVVAAIKAHLDSLPAPQSVPKEWAASAQKFDPLAGDPIGAEVYARFSGMPKGHAQFGSDRGGQIGASQELSNAGVRGIRYLDGGSRNQAQRWIAKHPKGGENVFNSEAELAAFVKRNPEFTAIKPDTSYNYVVFPGMEDKVKILERNGIPIKGLLE
jgi:hypothetical protein